MAAKTGNARERYNRASRLASAVLQRWNEVTERRDATLAAAVRSMPGPGRAVGVKAQADAQGSGADPVDLVQDRTFRVAGTEEVGVQGVDPSVVLDGPEA